MQARLSVLLCVYINCEGQWVVDRVSKRLNESEALINSWMKGWINAPGTPMPVVVLPKLNADFWFV